MFVILPPDGQLRSIVMQYVCLSVSLFPHITQNHIISALYQCFLRVAYVHWFGLLWWRCGTLCTSGLFDDVMCSHNGPLMCHTCIPKRRQNTTILLAEISNKFYTTLNTSKYSSWVVHQGRSLPSTTASFVYWLAPDHSLTTTAAVNFLCVSCFCDYPCGWVGWAQRIVF